MHRSLVIPCAEALTELPFTISLGRAAPAISRKKPLTVSYLIFTPQIDHFNFIFIPWRHLTSVPGPAMEAVTARALPPENKSASLR